jgi:hypothetical protein
MLGFPRLNLGQAVLGISDLAYLCFLGSYIVRQVVLAIDTLPS